MQCIRMISRASVSATRVLCLSRPAVSTIRLTSPMTMKWSIASTQSISPNAVRYMSGGKRHKDKRGGSKRKHGQGGKQKTGGLKMRPVFSPDELTNSEHVASVSTYDDVIRKLCQEDSETLSIEEFKKGTYTLEIFEEKAKTWKPFTNVMQLKTHNNKPPAIRVPEMWMGEEDENMNENSEAHAMDNNDYYNGENPEDPDIGDPTKFDPRNEDYADNADPSGTGDEYTDAFGEPKTGAILKREMLRVVSSLREKGFSLEQNDDGKGHTVCDSQGAPLDVRQYILDLANEKHVANDVDLHELKQLLFTIPGSLLHFVECIHYPFSWTESIAQEAGLPESQ